ncbi:hypothetical protein [Phycisphaera mikurensis]|nr:hypothetical protein [Phycisphaera mikurensis]MBB6440391.1 hypothetical protein [Phycisphaera mikurensis]
MTALPTASALPLLLLAGLLSGCSASAAQEAAGAGAPARPTVFAGPGLWSEVRVLDDARPAPTPAPATMASAGSRWTPTPAATPAPPAGGRAVAWGRPNPTPAPAGRTPAAFRVEPASVPTRGLAPSTRGLAPSTRGLAPSPASAPSAATTRPASPSGLQRLDDPGANRLADVPAGSEVIFWN